MRATEILRNAVKDKLGRGEVVASMAVRLVKAIECADEIAAVNGVDMVLIGVGGLANRPKLAAEFVATGARMISTGADLQFLLASATEKVDHVREIKL